MAKWKGKEQQIWGRGLYLIKVNVGCKKSNESVLFNGDLPF